MASRGKLPLWLALAEMFVVPVSVSQQDQTSATCAFPSRVSDDGTGTKVCSLLLGGFPLVFQKWWKNCLKELLRHCVLSALTSSK